MNFMIALLVFRMPKKITQNGKQNQPSPKVERFVSKKLMNIKDLKLVGFKKIRLVQEFRNFLKLNWSHFGAE